MFLGKGFQTIERHVDEGLENETEETLNRRIKADIVQLCQERGLPSEGEKSTLIRNLLGWVRNECHQIFLFFITIFALTMH